MMKEKSHVTPAIRFLKANGVSFIERPYVYVDRGGTSAFEKQYLVDEHRVIKTLVMEDEKGAPLIILMHGDQEVSTKELARTVAVKKSANGNFRGTTAAELTVPSGCSSTSRFSDTALPVASRPDT